MENIVKACPKCGENGFIIIETLIHEGSFDDGVLIASGHPENETSDVICKNCDEHLNIDEIEVEYC